MSSLPALLNLVVTTLQTCSYCTSVAVVETKEFSDEQFFVKVRAELSGSVSFQVRIYYNRGHQVFFLTRGSLKSFQPDPIDKGYD